ncbi:MAG TPA: iron ABC transporter permease [Cytophagaceae bacterium]|jgi:iron complex transport system permease protein|nr:iron ABC transporter permease [Cytophagaceae bacterium]
MKKDSLIAIGLLGCTALTFLIGLSVGSADTSIMDVWNDDIFDQLVLFQLRMPRLLLAWEVGALLAVAGSVMQRVLNNPLADPYILGSAAGASFGAAMVRLAIGGTFILLPSVGAFAGAMFSVFIILLISRLMGASGRHQILLAGVAISSFLMALLSFIYYLHAGDNILKTLIFWSFGSFEMADWTGISILLPLLAVTLVLQPLWHKQLGLMLLGEDRAEQLGQNTNALRWQALLFSAVLVAFCVAQAGPIGFVGLMVPHWVRSLFGMHRFSVGWEVLIGGYLLLLAEVMSRFLVYPAGLPPGIMTAMMGVPFFVYLLIRKKYNFQ